MPFTLKMITTIYIKLTNNIAEVLTDVPGGQDDCPVVEIAATKLLMAALRGMIAEVMEQVAAAGRDGGVAAYQNKNRMASHDKIVNSSAPAFTVTLQYSEEDQGVLYFLGYSPLSESADEKYKTMWQWVKATLDIFSDDFTQTNPFANPWQFEEDIQEKIREHLQALPPLYL